MVAVPSAAPGGIGGHGLMRFEEISAILKGIPWMTPQRGRALYDHVLATKPEKCLDLGTGHGLSSCYMAAALQELGRGRVVTVDLLKSVERPPIVEELLARSGLIDYVTVVREHTSYTWFLKKEIERLSDGLVCRPDYDFCFVDGPKNWTIDGFAFFLVDKLLRQGGWILFDGYCWSYGASGKDVNDGISNRNFGPDEISARQVGLIFDLLVMQHPNFGEFRIEDDWWAWAKKISAPRPKLTLASAYSIGDIVKIALERLVRRTGRRDASS